MAATGTDIRFGDADSPEDLRFTVRRAAQLGYGLAALAVFVGWLINRGGHLVDPLKGIGYWLGIVGASLMAVLLLYPLRKKLRFMGYFGATRHWFRMHMVFGVLGPVLILFHSNFALGSLNSNVALICMLLVAGSGLVGRYIHAKIFADLDGHRTTLRELAEKAKVTAEQRAHVAALVPELLERITVFDKSVLEPPHGIAAALLLPAKLAFTTRWEGTRLAFIIRRRLREQARKSPVIAKQRTRLTAALTRFAREHLRRVRKVAELNSYERMFGLWHLFHLPFFYMLVVTAIVHVVAVHMY
ncbi:MAG TPA: hypothetical protein VL131_10985 [Gammaproteobacteria bacterium]|nr:hypothetical protein [Gammaproteobacteria bacterium]